MNNQNNVISCNADQPRSESLFDIKNSPDYKMWVSECALSTRVSNLFSRTTEKSTVQDSVNSEAAEPVPPVVEDPDKDKKDLKKLEHAVHSCIKQERTIGQPLSEISERKLYKVKGYKSFRVYCQHEFGITATHAYRMIAHCETCKLLGIPMEDVPEKTTRPLSILHIRDEAKRKIWDEAKKIKSGKYPETNDVKRCVAKSKQSRVETSETSPGSVYVKRLGISVPVSDLTMTLINKTRSAVELIQVSKEVSQELSDENRECLKQECIKRLNTAF